MSAQTGRTGPGGTPAAPLFPQFECDGVLFGPDYMEVPLAGLIGGTNPECDTCSVHASDVGKTWWVGVVPSVGECSYTLAVKLNGTNVAGSPWTGTVDASNGEVQTPATGETRMVLQYFPGTLRRSAPPVSDLWAWWDGYLQKREPDGLLIWAPGGYVVSDASPGTHMVSAGEVNAWWMVGPEAWETYDRGGTAPMYNIWYDILPDASPKPGDQSGAHIPAQMTFSFQTADTNPKANYQWSVVRNTSASRRAYSGDASTTAAISQAFHGTDITWVYRKGPLGGSADICIDGTDAGHKVATVSCYNATTQWQQTWTSGALSDADHTICIMNSGVAGAGGGCYIYHDKFVAAHDHAEQTDPTNYGACRNMENNLDGMTLYKWGRVASASAHGDFYMGEASTAALAAFTFSGDSIDLVYRRGPLGGNAKVYIDGVDKGTVNMYDATTQWWNNATNPAVTAYTGLGTGTHTMMVANTGVKGTGGGYYVYIDAFRYPSGTGTYYEEWDYPW